MSNNKLCPVLNAKIMAQSIEEVPVIIQLNENNRNLIKNVSNLSSKVKADLPLIGGIAGNMSTDIIYRLSTTPEVDYISFDSNVYALLDVATPTMEAYFPHEKGYDGNGISVAVIDTGVAPHDDLVKPTNRIISFMDFVNNKEKPYDDNGHGTHVAGIIAGNGYSSRGKYVGIAPKSNIIGIKALDENGGGSTSDIIAALSYCIEMKDKYNIKIINLSLGTPATHNPEKDPLVKAVEKCVEAGIIVVTAAGNSGPSARTILSPGISKEVITVGAVDDKRTIDPSDDTIAPFSSRGPTPEGLQKPDLVAPGVNINSISHSKLDSYTSLSGTSMATPLVSGSLALLLNKHTNLSPKEFKSMLTNACMPLNEDKESQGYGMLNLRVLFNSKDDPAEQEPIKSNILGLSDDTLETVIMLLVVLFLLDSRI
ncbi:S8 family peptidase [Tissierella sp. Yu-01]|uniref:S8 family peptidase n=1 Tax=Tissierella sp. Yu-01 TaxID=3035694 RepID=UPI00240E760C|nr:S8 family peptidase [Tissierella sp. Yu-01]WFA10460.1 S8 family peptidase [Tissierella sp. Yu-01]